jgi:hypothetical protein
MTSLLNSLRTAIADASHASSSVLGTGTASDPWRLRLIGPLQIEVDGNAVYVAQNFAGVLTKVTKHGSTDLATPGGEIAGVTLRGGSVLYTSGDGESPAHEIFRLSRGETTQLADTLDHEQAHDPDAAAAYGLDPALPEECAGEWPATMGSPRSKGIVDSHAYALAHRNRVTYIADAGANDILAMGPDGTLRTVAVLPPQPTVITREAADANGMPDCVVDHPYNFEPVPTDVEVGRDGYLYVTTLPGGPEDPSLGARGSVYRVDPRSGEVRQLATGFLGATNLAVTPQGDIYVAELFGGRISKVVDGAPETVIELPAPAGLEYAHGKLYVAYDVFPPEGGPPNGTLATINLGGRS